MSAQVQRMENWKELAIGALIAQGITSGWLYLRSISNKVSKEDHDKALATQKTEHDKAITALASEFATAMASLKTDSEKSIAALKAEIEKTNSELKHFARQAVVDEVKGDIRRLDTKLEAKLDGIQQLILTQMAQGHK